MAHPAALGTVWDAELRLITGGGEFDPATGHYLYNIVAYARTVALGVAPEPECPT